MKPSRLQHSLAYSVEIAAAAGILGAWVFGLCFAGNSVVPVLDISYVAGFLILVVLSIPGGAVLGVIFLLPFLRMLACKINGAPFKLGDSVEILRGPYRGTVTRVYETWESRYQLRVVLGEAQKKSVTDVFDIQEVCRVKN